MQKYKTEALHTAFSQLSEVNKQVILGKTEALIFAQDCMGNGPEDQPGETAGKIKQKSP